MLTIEVEIEIETEAEAETARKPYYAEDRNLLVSRVGEGTDGNLYLVPAEA